MTGSSPWNIDRALRDPRDLEDLTDVVEEHHIPRRVGDRVAATVQRRRDHDGPGDGGDGQQVLAHIAHPDVVQSLATGNTPAVAYNKLNVLRVGHKLDLGIGSYGTDSPHRPDLVKHAINRAAEHRGAMPSEVIVVGDTPWDMDAARAYGAVAVGIATGAFDEEELHASGATLALPSLGTPQHRQRLYGLLGIERLA